MKVLLIKTSSMGDLIHTLPALTDAGHALPGIRFDWVVEDSFTDIPAWHPLVDKVIPVALRRWRKGVFSRATRTAWSDLRKELRANEYDLVLDAQGLVKSAFITLFTRGMNAGLDWGSAREPLASLVYQRKCTVNFYQHAVVRMRSLFSQALDYPLPETAPDFGLDRRQFNHVSAAMKAEGKYIVFLHGTTWTSKQWPESCWIKLAAAMRMKWSERVVSRKMARR
jgi:heptosyltransferase-1